jgi:hypothetical protein
MAGATDALEPEVHMERNSRGKLVVYCADTYFKSLRSIIRGARTESVRLLRSECTRLSRK